MVFFRICIFVLFAATTACAAADSGGEKRTLITDEDAEAFHKNDADAREQTRIAAENSRSRRNSEAERGEQQRDAMTARNETDFERRREGLDQSVTDSHAEVNASLKEGAAVRRADQERRVNESPFSCTSHYFI